MPRLPGTPGSRAARDVPEAPATTSYRDATSTTRSSVTGTGPRERVGRQAKAIPRPRRVRSMGRRAIVAAVALVAGVVGAAAISRSIADVIETRAQVAEARRLNAGIRAQVDAGRREIEFAQGDAYLRFAARGLGYGRARETAFALRDDAEPAPSITPLGAGQGTGSADVLSDFVDLLLQP